MFCLFAYEPTEDFADGDWSLTFTLFLSKAKSDAAARYGASSAGTSPRAKVLCFRTIVYVSRRAGVQELLGTLRVPGSSILKEAPESVADHVRSDDRSGWGFVARRASVFCGVRLEGPEFGGGSGGWLDDVGGRDAAMAWRPNPSRVGTSVRARRACSELLLRCLGLSERLLQSVARSPASQQVSLSLVEAVNLSSAWTCARITQRRTENPQVVFVGASFMAK